MPYEKEFAQFRSIRRLVDSDHVRALLGDFALANPIAEPFEKFLFGRHALPPCGDPCSWILAVDGSHVEVFVKNGYPQAEASYVSVASVLIDAKKVNALSCDRPIDPVELRKTQHAESIDAALPGCNVYFRGEDSSRDSLRRALFNVLASHRMAAEGESLLDTYEALLRLKPSAKGQQCPVSDCPLATAEFRADSGEYRCQCPRKAPWFSTDGLRIHEGMNLEGTNGALFAEVMQVWERIWVIHVLRTLEQKGWLRLMRHIAIVLDGPLAVFGHPAWLSHAISAELGRLNEKVRAETAGQDILWIGIEKSGQFVEHFANLDIGQDGSGGGLPLGSLLLLDDIYIKQRIIFSNSSKPYGQDTYFGRKLFYKTASGARIVASLPVLRPEDRDTGTASIDQFPRIGDAIALLDQFVQANIRTRCHRSFSPTRKLRFR